MKKTLCAFTFLALLTLLSLLLLLLPKRTFSENENRYLAKFPELSGKTLLDGSFSRGFEDYVTDAFPFRDGWVSLKTAAERAMGKRESGGIYFARDGYLIERFDEPDAEKFDENLKYAASFQKNAGIDVDIMLVPSSAHVLQEKLPKFAPTANEPALFEKAAAAADIVDVSKALRLRRDDYVYYRTDHHWTSLGAYIAYSVWRGGRVPPLSEYESEVLSRDFFGTTYSKASLYNIEPDTITAYSRGEQVRVNYNMGEYTSDSIYEREYLKKKDKYSVFLNANQSVSEITTETKNGRKLLLIKDSYANAFVQFLLSDYEKIYVIDLRYFKIPISEFIEATGATEALILYSLKGFCESGELYALDISCRAD